jgi:potassium-transporting ATPase KdpC subunit
MKKYLLPSIKLTLVLLVLCCVVYFAIVSAIGKATKGSGEGEKVLVNNKVVGYKRIGQKFTEDKFFWGRPSAVDYNAAGSAGSNKGPSNPDYLKIVQDRLDTFLVHNPGVNKKDVPAEMITASGSGLDPHISPASAYLQLPRVAKVRNIDEAKIKLLIDQITIANPIGPDVVNVLELNAALEQLH